MGQRQRMGRAMDRDDDTERDAIAALQRGDINGLDLLVRRYQISAIRVAFGITSDRAAAEDVVAEAFITAFARIGQFDSRRAFAPWFYRIVVNDALKIIRRKRPMRMPACAVGALADRAEAACDPEAASLRREMQGAIIDAIQTLPPPQRTAVILRYYLDLDEAAIAAILGCPRGTVKWRLYAARQRLRPALAAFIPRRRGMMNRRDAIEEQAVAAALADHLTRRIPATIDLLPRVRQRLMERERGGDAVRKGVPPRLRRGIVLALAVLLIVTGGIAVAASAVPQVRETLQRLLPNNGGAGIAESGDGADVALQPPSFRVALLGYIPAGLTQRSTSYVPPNQPGAVQLPAIIGGGGPVTPGSTPAYRPPDDLLLRLTALAGGKGAYWVRRYTPADARYLDVTEVAMQPGQPLPPGETLTVVGNHATVRTQGSVTTLALFANGTSVTIETNLGRSEAVKIAQHLRWQPIQPTVTPRPTIPPAAATANAATVIANLPKADPAKVVASVNDAGTVRVTAPGPLCPSGSVGELNGVQFIWHDVVYVLNTTAEGNGYGISATEYGAPSPPLSVTHALTDTLFALCQR